METIWRCKEHNVEFTKREDVSQHEWEFHTPFKEPCLLNGRPCSGLCTLKEHYEACKPPTKMRNNWMCWRDGILHEEIKV